VAEPFILGVDLDGVCAVDPWAGTGDEPEERVYRDLEPIEGAAETLWRLSDAGVWIRVVTHRLHVNGGHRAAVIDTVEWLDRAHIPYRDLCFLGAKPQVEADLYVDDSPDNIAALRKAGNEVVVFDQPYNQDQRAPRAHGWAEVEEIVMERFTERQGVHGVQTQLPGVDGTLGRRLGSD
jgi:5'-nucleotidase